MAAGTGALLILIEGVAVGLFGSSLPSWLYSVLFSLSPGAEGTLMVCAGAAIMGLAFLAYHAPNDHRLDGAAIWIIRFVVGLTALISAGFYVGSFLVGIGASHIFWWRPNQVGGAEGIRRLLHRI